MRTTFEKIVFRAGLDKWERLLQNLRASRSKELFSEFPAHVASEWMGQSPTIAQKHYLQPRDEDFDKAIGKPKKKKKDGDALVLQRNSNQHKDVQNVK